MSDFGVKEFAGIPVTGYGSRDYHRDGPQRSKEELAEKVRQILAVPEVDAIRWRQYTPYFNDGEQCYFGVHGVTFKLKDAHDPDGGDYEDGFLDTYDIEIRGGRRGRYSYDTRKYEYYGDPLPRHSAADDLEDFESIGNGSFDHALQELFGDHVQVTVTREGITVDDYDHE